MKLQTSMREIRDNSHRLISVGYCDIQHLLYFEQAFAYSAGIYGWNCDHYNINGVTISTGYRPPAAKNTKKLDYDTRYNLDQQAAKIISDHLRSNYEQAREQVRELLNTFIELSTVEGKA